MNCKSLLFLLFILITSCRTKSHNQIFSLVRDPTSISVFGLQWVHPTQNVKNLTPLFEPKISTGGVEFDPSHQAVYTANFEGIAAKVYVQSHKTAWRFKYHQALTMQPYYIASEKLLDKSHNLLILGAQNGQVMGLDADSGKKLWSYDVGGEIYTQALFAQDRLIVTNSINQVTALDPTTGKYLWQYHRDFPEKMSVLGHSGVLIHDRSIYSGFSDGYVVSLLVEDGSMQWQKFLAFKGDRFIDSDATPELFDDKLFVSSYEDGVFALHPKNGETIWQADLRGVVRILVAEHNVYALSAEGKCVAYEAQTGRLIWTFKFNPASVTKPLFYRGYVVFGLLPEGLFVLDAYSGRLIQRFHVGGIGSEITIKDGVLGFLSEGSFAYLLRYGQRNPVSVGIPHRYVGL